MRKLLSFLFRYSPKLVALAIVVSTLMGLANTVLLSILKRAMDQPGDPAKGLTVMFFGLCFVLPVCRFTSQILMTHLGQKAVFDLRMHLSRQILAAPLAKLEEYGANKLLAALTGDVRTITTALLAIPLLCMDLTIVVSCLFYLLLLSWQAGLGVLAALLLGVFTYRVVVNKGMFHMRSARREQDALFKHYEAIARGTKELKLHRKRRHSFLDELLQLTAASFRRSTVWSQAFFALAGGLGQLFFFLAIGVSVFLLPQWLPGIPNGVLIGYTIVLLYLITPLGNVSSFVPTLGMAVVALDKVRQLGIGLEKLGEKEIEITENRSWKSLVLEDVSHTYHLDQEDMAFKLGPLSLSCRPGELIFLTGGNGSGKTTLAKILTGLYLPETGRMLWDGQPVDDHCREDFRQLFTAVFSDFYLFETLLGMDRDGLDERVGDYLAKLQLDHKVTVEDGVLSTLELSAGQRKRLALLTAYLEDRPIYLFDEWAADQDPSFKEIFYRSMLPELKARGKTVFVISHDDHYYHVADRLIKLDYGQIEFDKPVEAIRERAAFPH